MAQIIHFIGIGAAVALMSVVLAFVGGFIAALKIRAQVKFTHFFNKHGNGAKAYILLSGTPEAINAAAEVVVQVLNNTEREQEAARNGIALNDQPNTGSPEPRVPTEDQPGGGQEER